VRNDWGNTEMPALSPNRKALWRAESDSSAIPAIVRESRPMLRRGTMGEAGCADPKMAMTMATPNDRRGTERRRNADEIQNSGKIRERRA
jgi:hypothetical protein